MSDAVSLPLLRWFDPGRRAPSGDPGLAAAAADPAAPGRSKMAVRAFGLNFPNPIGMAAGFDKALKLPMRCCGWVRLCRDRLGDTGSRKSAIPAGRCCRLERDEAVDQSHGLQHDGADAVLRRLPRARITAASSRQCRGQQGPADRVAGLCEN